LPAGLDRFLARQFSHPEGLAGRLLLGPLLNHIGGQMMRDAFFALDVEPGEPCLDLGFGGGALVERMLKAGATVTGVDRSAAMVARAQARFAQGMASGRACFLEASADALPLPDRSVQKAASVNALYFWPDLLVVMRELARVVQPGGRLVLGFQTAAAVRSWPGHVHGFHAFEDAEISHAVSEAGFVLLDVRPGFHPAVRDYRTLIARRDAQ